MKRLALQAIIIGMLISVSVKLGFADPGWSDYGQVANVVVTTSEVQILFDVAPTPNRCSTNDWFLYKGNQTILNRFYATALFAMNTGAELRVWQNNACLRGSARFTMIEMRP